MSNPTKDKEMASHLKKRGVVRTSGRCPVCHKIVQLNQLPNHLRNLCRSKAEK